MKKHRAVRALVVTSVIGVLLLLLTGCAAQSNFVASDAADQVKEPIAVVPFDNLSGHPEAGVIVAELFQDELYEASGRRVNLVSPEQVAALSEKLDEQPHNPAKLGEMLGAKAIIVGRVNEFAYKHVLGEDPAVSLSVRLVDVGSGDVLWNAALSRTGRCSWFKQDSLSRLSHSMCEDLARWVAAVIER